MNATGWRALVVVTLLATGCERIPLETGAPTHAPVAFLQEAPRVVRTPPAAVEPAVAEPTVAAAPAPAPVVAATPRTQDRAIRNKWAVIVGISQYAKQGETDLPPLTYADKDARDVAEALKTLGWPGYGIKLLVNQEATKRNVEVALENWLSKAGRDDVILLYWSGHGFPDPEDPTKVYFACYDSDIHETATGYRMDRVVNTLGERSARNVLVIADTCHAGKLITRGGDRGLMSRVTVDSMIQQKPVPAGWVYMVGADADRQAIEHSQWSNGAFTKVLLDGLRGGADGFESAGAKDGVITAGELKEYLYSHMPEETQRVLGTARRPTIATSSGDPGIWDLPVGRLAP